MRATIKKMLSKLGKALNADLREELQHAASQEAQVLLYHLYRDMASRQVVPSFAEVGFRCHSEFEEDGILLFIFALIGTANKTVVEISPGDGLICMSANLVLNHGWWGYLFDGDEANVRRGNDFFRYGPDTFKHPPRFTQAWITAENVNEVLTQAGVTGEIDLLSLDIDGMDYWVWKAIDCIRPRVVVCETHNIIPPEDALTAPYDPEFRRTIADYGGASLAAMAKLADEKGYRLVGTHRYGFNAFFILKELGVDLLPALTPAECLQDPFSREARETRWPKVKGMKWVRV